MTTKENLLEQFTVAYNENGWFVALENALAGLKADEAWRTEGGLDHSIGELVEHLRYWNAHWLRRFTSGVVDESKATTDETFRGADARGEAEWETLKAQLFQVFAEWKAALEAANEAKFDEQVAGDYQEPWSVPLAHQNMHNAYHIGQIVVMRKLFGSWNSAKGVS